MWMFKMRRRLHIEWQQAGSSSGTCSYASETWSNLVLVVEELRRELSSLGISMSATQVRPQQQIGQAIQGLLFNRVPLEELLPELRIPRRHCPSCEAQRGESVLCPAVIAEGVEYRSLPPFLLRRAILTSVGMMQPLRPLNLAQAIS
ncbi:MAG TPA: DUF2703 domain-containing protein [Nitrospiraceae bacterium]|nr:DUF2703 domain-containing protein [Nitrospiraceae bacterium]